MPDDTPIVLSKSAILKGLAAFVYQFDGYSDYAEGWAIDGYNLFLKGASGEFDSLLDAEEEDEDDD